MQDYSTASSLKYKSIPSGRLCLACISENDCALSKRSAQYLVFVFLTTQKEAKRTKNVQCRPNLYGSF